MDIRVFLDYCINMDRKALLINDEELDNWNKTYGMPRNHIKEAVANLRNAALTDDILIQGYQNALRAEAKIVDKMLNGLKFSELFNAKKFEKEAMNSNKDCEIVVIANEFKRVRTLLDANRDATIYLFLLDDKECDSIYALMGDVHISLLSYFYGVVQILYLVQPFVKKNTSIKIFLNDCFFLATDANTLNNVNGIEIFWSISFQIRYMKEYLGIYAVNNFEMQFDCTEQAIVWDGLLYKKVEGLSKQGRTSYGGKIKAAFYNGKYKNDNGYLNYPHGWVGTHLSQPVLKFYENVNEFDICPFCCNEKSVFDSDLVIFWEFPTVDDATLLKALEEGKQIVLCAMESVGVNKGNEWRINFLLFDRVMTWRENLLESKQLYYIPPVYFEYPMNVGGEFINYKHRKNMVIIGSIFWQNNFPYCLYKKREEFIFWMEKYHYGELDFYGKKTTKTVNTYKSYLGPVENKLTILSKYRFCICFENNYGHNNYVTEKIYDCIFAKCVPIYWGAPNIEEFIPKECFINMSDFSGFEELYNFIEVLEEDEWNKYIIAMDRFINTTTVLERYNGNAMIHDFKTVIYEVLEWS